MKVFYICLCLLVVFTLSCKKGADTSILAQVGDKKITVDDFKKQFDKLSSIDQEQAMTDEGRASLLKNLIYKELLETEAKAEGIDKQKSVLDRLEASKRGWFINRLYRDLIGNPALVTDEVFKDYKAKHWKEEIHLQIVIVNDLNKLIEFKDKVTRGEKWTDLAPKYGDSNWEISLKGDLGWVLYGALGGDLDERIWGLKTNTISDVIELNPHSFALARVLERRPARLDSITEEQLIHFKGQLYETRKVERILALTDSAWTKMNASIDSAALEVYLDAGNNLHRRGKYADKKNEKLVGYNGKLHSLLTPEQKKMVILRYDGKTMTLEEAMDKAISEGPVYAPVPYSKKSVRDFLKHLVFIESIIKKAYELKLDKDPGFITDMDNKYREFMVDELYDKKITSKINVKKLPLEKLQDCYNRHKNSFADKPGLKVAWIINENKDTLENVRKLAKTQDFGELAKKYSVNEDKAKGGLRGLISSDDPFLGEHYDNLLKLKDGEISTPVEIEGSSKNKATKYAIVKVIGREKPRIKSFDSVKSQVEDLYVLEEKERLLQELLKELYNKYNVKEYNDSLKKMDLKITVKDEGKKDADKATKKGV